MSLLLVDTGLFIIMNESSMALRLQEGLMYLNYFQVSSFQRRILSQPKMQDPLQGLKDYLILNSKYQWSGQIIPHLNNLE